MEVKGTAPIRIISLLLFAVCGTLCQSPPSLTAGSQPGGSSPVEVQRAETRSWQSLPDAPSPMEPPTLETAAAAHVELGNLAPLEPGFTAFYQLRTIPNQSADSFARYLDFQLPKPDTTYDRSTSASFLGRASHAASSVLVTHSASGRPRLNAAYCLGMLTLAAVHTAYRPYWERTSGAVFGDFGVTIGSNAGINVFHEFEPAIRDKARSMTPKFIYRLEERFTHDHP